MKKRLLTLTLAGIMVMSLMAPTFADDTENTTDKAFGPGGEGKGRVEREFDGFRGMGNGFKGDSEGFPGQGRGVDGEFPGRGQGEGMGKHNEGRGERKEGMGEKFENLIDTYAPDLADEFAAEKEETKAIHDSFKEVHEQIMDIVGDDLKEIRDEFREEMKTYIDSVKEQVKNGEMTREEAFEAIKTYKEENKPENDLIPLDEEAMEALKESGEALRAESKELRENLKAAVEAEDTDAIAELLADILEQSDAHQAHMQEKLELWEDALEELQ